MNRGAQILAADIGDKSLRTYTTELVEEIEKLVADGRIAGRRAAGAISHNTVWSWSKGFSRPRYYDRMALSVARGIPHEAWDEPEVKKHARAPYSIPPRDPALRRAYDAMHPPEEPKA